ncbi:type II toxin-antitoxin system prevent-host-death family antitoxin [Faecalicatena contorta]|uniref:type II toxin-antitoxin system prevent-host-death family antitoxin n=1 Tax=Faecalicatena contorta TaxID=39482 RepID=UPI001F348826|nr:type II toxin-antitoxin system prevent-host-death family antitoxin [Faecalicatena contorta]MCF2554386.1 type II toxin-antitoxin system Phd/YefM family antitoxin [Faecalicatena contorta]
MPNIKPITDLRNYTEVLKETKVGSPVFLTRNGRGEYVLFDMKEYDYMKAELELMKQLAEGERSAREKGWLTADEVEKALGVEE